MKPLRVAFLTLPSTSPSVIMFSLSEGPNSLTPQDVHWDEDVHTRSSVSATEIVFVFFFNVP